MAFGHGAALLTFGLLSPVAAPLDGGTRGPSVVCPLARPLFPEPIWRVEGRSLCHDAMG